MTGIFDEEPECVTYTPAKHFGEKVIGYATVPPIASFPSCKYEVIKIINLLFPAGRTFVTNVWYKEHSRIPLVIAEQLGAVFEPFVEEPTTTLLKRRRAL